MDRPHKRLYALSPNIGRISFASQQIRALNLVWALRKATLIKKNSLVAVVGAGISGVTAAVALRAYECTVRVFDRGARPLYRQRATTHRNVHPNINWWPTEEFLLPTTELPFLDWSMGQCNDVIGTLADQWAKLEKQSGNDLVFYPNKDVEEVVPVQANENRLSLIIGRETIKDFDAVIVASGFGEERPFLDIQTPSYWDDRDGLESLRDNDGNIRKFVVSGFGDGGLIDALRIAYDFDYGKLSFRFAEALAVQRSISEKMRQIESRYDDAGWKAYALQYEQLAEEIVKTPNLAELNAVLKEKLQEHRQGLVLMTDRDLDYPYQSGAAPTHKLMIAYAKYNGVLAYTRGVIERTGNAREYRVGGATYSENDAHFVVRHGAAFYPGGLILPDEWTKLEDAQRQSLDHNFKPAWLPEPFAVPDGWPCRDRQAGKYIESLQDLAQKAFWNMGSRAKVVPKEDRFEVYDHNLAFRPARLFGKAVSYLPIDQLNAARAL